MIVLPSDHLIKNEEVFLQSVKDASKFINDYRDGIITLGMSPSRPETGYGYIKKLNKSVQINNSEVYEVERFVEKPNLATAVEYLAEGSYLWNGGMFLWNVNSILEKIERYIPNTYNALSKILEISDEEVEEYLEENYKKTDSISIDYGILEKMIIYMLFQLI